MGMNDKHDYDPTKWVDNSEPDIDAEHLNKIEAALQEYGISIDELAAAVGQRIMQSQIVNNLLATEAGNVLDAMQGKALNEKITEANKNISNNADAITKLNGDLNPNIHFLDAGFDDSSFDRGVLDYISAHVPSGAFILYCSHSSVSVCIGFIVANGMYGTVLRMDYNHLWVTGREGDVWGAWKQLY